MRSSKRLMSRLVAGACALATGITGAVVLNATPVQSAERSDYGFKTFAYGTFAKAAADSVDIASGRTAFSHLLCTRNTGLSRDAFVADVSLPAESPQLHASAVSSTSETYRNAAGDVGTRSVNRIAELVIGDPSSAHILIKGFTTTSKAWADANGKLHAASNVSSVDIVPQTGSEEIDGLLDDVGVGGLLDVIESEGGEYAIPGLGTLSLGAATPLDGDVHDRFARAKASVLRIELEALPGSIFTVGHSFARIDKVPHSGTIGGYANGAEIPKALGGILAVGEIGHKILPCMGTDGEYRHSEGLDLNLTEDAPLGLGKAAGIVMGIVRNDGFLLAQTTGRLASLQVGDQLQVNGIVGRATVKRTEAGKIKKSIAGSTIAELIIDGEAQEIPDPGETLEIPGVAKLTFFDRDKTRKSLEVTALTVELLNDDAAPIGTVLKFGTAKAQVHNG